MYAATPVTDESPKENTAETLTCTQRTLRGYPVIEPEKDDHKENLITLLEEYETRLKERTQLHLGYPYNLDFDFSNLQSLQRYSINNLGDPCQLWCPFQRIRNWHIGLVCQVVGHS